MPKDKLGARGLVVREVQRYRAWISTAVPACDRDVSDVANLLVLYKVGGQDELVVVDKGGKRIDFKVVGFTVFQKGGVSSDQEVRSR